MLLKGLKMFLTVILKGPQVSNVNIKGKVNKGPFKIIHNREKEEKRRLFK